jgi:ABC-type lipoprotein release transport system permease subunit
MQTLAFKMLFLKKGTASAIFSIALLIALLTSVNCLVNNINAQTTALTQLASVGETYVLTSEGSSSLSNSQINTSILTQIKNNTDIKYATSQQLFMATLTLDNQTHSITVHGVDDVQAYLKKNGANINGTYSKTDSQANVGIILANQAFINKNNNITLTVNGQSTQLKIVGITTTQSQSDTQLIIPLTTLQNLTQQNTTISYIEFSIKDTSKANQTISNLTQTLPSTIKITGTQQIVAFASDINTQTVTFINVWSIAIYIVVMAASYITCSRLINEAEYYLYTLRTLGAKKTSTLNLILIFVLVIALVGSILGLSVGVVGTQLASTAVRWVFGNTQLAPFIEVNQTLQILGLSLAAATIGAIYPAVKGSQIVTRENPT